nr:MAG TPA_asm: hypothetical protein [Bacteriophage sp.]
MDAKDLEYLKKQRRTRNHFLILPQFGGSWRTSFSLFPLFIR